MRKLALILLILFTMISCKPDMFILNERLRGNMIGCKILSDIDLVKKTADNSVRIFPGGRLAMKVIELTEHESDFTIKILKGNGIKFAFRTVENNFDAHSSLILHLTSSETKLLDESGNLLETSDHRLIDLDQKYRLRCINKAKNLKIYLDCDEILNISTNYPATEYVIIESIDDSEIEISGIDIFDAYLR